jgi:TolB-like protein/DNA-binding winged helix-turn-helix (wHTH) protein
VADQPPPRLTVNGITADFEAGLLRDAAGREIPLRAQSFAVLRHLAANAGRVVTKDELAAAVWPGIAVTDDSLVQCVRDIRRALGDEAQAALKTAPRRGYRLVPPAAAGAPPWRRASLAALPVLAVLAVVGAALWWRQPEAAAGGPPAVAVLPFDDMSADGSLGYMGAGVAEDVIAMLARSPDVLVIARNSSFVYGGEPVDVRKVGAELGVDFVLEGSVRREGDKLRIVAQLNDTTTGEHVWAERFDRAGADPWALVDEVSGKIIFALAGEGGELKRAQFREAWGKDTARLGEYDYFLRGLDVYYDAKTPEENERAGRIYAEGLERYPDSALLKVKLGWQHWTGAWRFWDDLERNFREADRLVTEVLAEDNLAPETQRVAYWLNAMVLMQRGAFDDAVKEAERTIAIAPYDARVLRNLTDVLIADGRYEMALDWLARAEPREPGREDEYVLQRALIYRLMGRYEDSLREYDTVEDPMAYPQFSRAIVLVRLGRLDEARAAVRAALEKDPSFTQAIWREGSFYSDPAILDGEIADLAAAGLPE